jgi:hypothetical protein
MRAFYSCVHESHREGTRDMARSGWFEDRPVGAVTLVEAPVSRSYAQKARVAFSVVGVLTAMVSAAVLLLWLHPLVAVALALVTGFVVGLVVGLVVRAWPVLRVLWWWSLELTLLTGLTVGLHLLARATHIVAALGFLLVLAAVVGLVRPVRRQLVAWAWCVAVRQRLRLCFAEFIRAANRMHPGSRPLILWARPTPAGARVWVWLRPGLELVDLEGRTGRLAVACWAGEARVVRASARYAALIRVDLARRDPLTGVVPAPLTALIPAQRTTGTPALTAVPPLGLDLADVPEPEPEPRARR